MLQYAHGDYMSDFDPDDWQDINEYYERLAEQENAAFDAELILRGHCAECWYAPGSHRVTCSKHIIDHVAELLDELNKLTRKTSQ